MKTLELYCGTKSFSKVMAAAGHSTFTFDNDAQHEPDVLADISRLTAGDLLSRGGVSLLWASPPCTHFSVAAISHNWRYIEGVLTPINPKAILAQEVVKHTLALIEATKPTWYFIENPRGMLRKMPFMAGMRRVTVTYCQYGEDRQKPTDIWTNAPWWNPKPICKAGAPCHVAAPRGAKTGTQAMRNKIEKGRIPPALFREILEQLPQ